MSGMANGSDGKPKEVSIPGAIVVSICVVFLLYKIIKQIIEIYNEIVKRSDNDIVPVIVISTIECNNFREVVESMETSL